MVVCAHLQAQYIENLQCEHLQCPVGIDAPAPRLSWEIRSNQQDIRQQTVNILVSADSLAVSRGEGTSWNSGEIKTDLNQIDYAGKTLQPFTPYFWKITIKDQNNRTYTSDISKFETGMMDAANWQGSWIDDNQDKEFRPAPYFRKAFTTGKEIKSARAYVAAAGLYELYINGRKTGNHRLDPMFTRFDRRILYVTYDVTDQLKKGDNAIGIVLGNGWYNHQSQEVWDFEKAGWRNRPRFCLDLRICYRDGTEEVIKSDRSWKTNSGAIVYNNIYSGEKFDQTKEQANWAQPGFDDSKWANASLKQAPADKIVSQQLYPIRNVEELKAKSVIRLNDTIYIYDFGRNIAGVTRLKIKGWENGYIRLKHAERLDKDGHADQTNINIFYREWEECPLLTDIVNLAKDKETDFMSKFTYKGFQYVEVTTNKPVTLAEDNLTAYFMHNDVPVKGSISSSSELINKVWAAGCASYLSNLFGIPTDCPQREKNGWTGDAHFAIQTGLYNFDAITVYEKWLADHRDEQQPNGDLPNIIPTSGWGYGTKNATDWTSSIAIIPWNIYLFYGDSQLLERCYDNIKRYVDYFDRISKNHLTTNGHGDWIPVKSHSNVELTSSVYFYADAVILSKAARLFGHKEDERHYTRLAGQIKKAINDKFLNTQKGIYASGTQAEMSVPLYWGVVPEEYKAAVAKNLAEDVKAKDFHLDVGTLGAKAILNALSMNGYDETAYRLSVQDTYPSWGCWIKNGANTFSENWDWNKKRGSHNHIMFGEVVAWYHKGLGGIYPDENQPGFKHTILKPYFPKDLKQFKASHHSPYGEICSSWERKGKKIYYKVVIPPNANATLFIPQDIKKDNGTIELTSGTHTFTFKEK